jgi:hypothetical protein
MHPGSQGSESRYVHGCRCEECLQAHAVRQRRYRADAKIKADQMKLELVELRAFRDQFISLAAQAPGSAQ